MFPHCCMLKPRKIVPFFVCFSSCIGHTPHWSAAISVGNGRKKHVSLHTTCTNMQTLLFESSSFGVGLPSSGDIKIKERELLWLSALRPGEGSLLSLSLAWYDVFSVGFAGSPIFPHAASLSYGTLSLGALSQSAWAEAAARQRWASCMSLQRLATMMAFGFGPLDRSIHMMVTGRAA